MQTHLISNSKLQGHPKRMRKVNYVVEVFDFHTCSGKKNSANYSPTPSRSLRNVLRLPSKAAPPTLADWKSGSRSPKRRSWRVLPGPHSTQRAIILGENPFFIPITQKFSFDPNSDLSAGQRPVFGWFEALFGLPEPDFHSASIRGSTFEGSLKTLLRYLDEVGE